MPKPLYKWASSFCMKCHLTARCDTNRTKGTFETILTILRQKAAFFLCHLTILLLLHSQKSTEQNKEMQTLAKSVTQNKATSCNSLPSLTTETFPYLSHVCTPSPPPTWSNPKLSECNKNQWVQNDRRSYSNHFHPIGIFVTLEHCINQPIVHKLST